LVCGFMFRRGGGPYDAGEFAMPGSFTTAEAAESAISFTREALRDV